MSFHDWQHAALVFKEQNVCYERWLRESWMSGYDFLFCIFILIYALSVHFGEYLICLVIFISYCFYEIGLRDSWTIGYNFLFLHFRSHLCTFHAFRRIPCLPGYLYFISFLWNRIVRFLDDWIRLFVFAFSFSFMHFPCIMANTFFAWLSLISIVFGPLMPSLIRHSHFVSLVRHLFISILIIGLFS